MASRCSTALVEPPSTSTTRMAFSKALRVMIFLGVRSLLISPSTALLALVQSVYLSLVAAGWLLLPGRLMPMASMALAIVFAVYMPPQLPSPGQVLHSTSLKSLRLIFPLAMAPTASKALTMSRSLPSPRPGRMVPP